MKRHVQGRAEPAWQGAHGVFPGSSPEVTCPVNGPAGGGGTAPMWALSLQRQEGTVSPRPDMLRCPLPLASPKEPGCVTVALAAALLVLAPSLVQPLL